MFTLLSEVNLTIIFVCGFVFSVPSSQTVCEASLLCELCNSLQGCQESLKGKQKSQNSPSKVPTQGESALSFAVML